MNSFHTSVLLKEALDFLNVSPKSKYIDATLGGGGHTYELLKRNTLVLGIDQDIDAINFVTKSLGSSANLKIVKGNFKDLQNIAHLNNFNKVSGILFDLGVSSYQIDEPERGFSFLNDGPLDMRMDKQSTLTADALVNVLEKGELYELFNKFGQDSRSWVISKSIASARRIKAIKTTSELSKIIQRAYGIRDGEISDFTKNKISKKIFQALRIAVNEEIDNLQIALPQALKLLDKKGRIVIITFHSIEDGVVKKMFKDFEKQKMGKIITKKPLVPSLEEQNLNSRAKSAKLRVFEKN